MSNDQARVIILAFTIFLCALVLASYIYEQTLVSFLKLYIGLREAQ